MAFNMKALLAQAAEFRSGGYSWQQVAKNLHRSPKTCQSWPTRYSATWHELYEAACAKRNEEAGSEALFIIRGMLRDKDPKTRLRAGELLLKFFPHRATHELDVVHTEFDEQLRKPLAASPAASSPAPCPRKIVKEIVERVTSKFALALAFAALLIAFRGNREVPLQIPFAYADRSSVNWIQPESSQEVDQMNPLATFGQHLTRRRFFQSGTHLLGGATLASMMNGDAATGSGGSHHLPKAKHVIYMHMVGGPSQIDLYDHKPKMKDFYDKDLPESIRNGQRLTTMTSGQARFPIAPSMFKFAQHGKCGMWVSELLPNTARMVDDMCFIRSMHTEAINHEPAITFMQTGNQVTGRPCLGAWTSYGLGSLNQNLPTFVVMVAQPTNTEQIQAISARLWQSGYLPGEHAAVPFRSSGDAILYINNPPGVPSEIRRKTLDGIKALNEINEKLVGDPETHTRIQQYEMAYRMQTSVPELTDLAREPANTFKLYGDAAKKPGTFANNVLMARRLVERGVRFVQIYLNNWDTHSNAAGRLPSQCRDVDQACYGLVQDLKARGLYDDTLLIWGGEFGRTIYTQGKLSPENYGRDHHPRCFTMWMAGGGSRAGQIYGETDDFSYNITKDPVHIRDFHASVLHLLGFDHQKFTYKYQGLDQRLTGVEQARVIHELLA